MRPIDHFYSQLGALENRRAGLGPEDKEHLIREFTRLAAPVLGGPAAKDLGLRTLDRITTGRKTTAPGPGSTAVGGLQKFGAIAAFLLGEYDDALPLDPEDWEDLRETLEDASGEMDLGTLTLLMGDLLSRGKLRP